MPRSLKLYIAGVAIASVGALVIATLRFAPGDDVARGIGTGPTAGWLGIAFWIAITLLASALPVRMPTGSRVDVSIAPVVASMVLGGPAVAGWVAAIGTTEVRELKGQIPWYGTITNHATSIIPAVLGGFVYELLRGSSSSLAAGFLAALVGAGAFFVSNASLASAVVSLRTGTSIPSILARDAASFYRNLLALAPVAWLMAQVYIDAGWWA
ncbi:MAG TPA: hypothetical protein VF960_13750, partial [Chloroflexota bacterium]